MQKILFATNFSAKDRDAFRIACRFANDWKAKLLIVHADDSSQSDSPYYLPHTLDPNQQLFKIVPSNLDIVYEHMLRKGDPVEVIQEIEAQENVDLIVLGTHGREGLDRTFEGSVAEQILRHSKCPVVTLRRPQSGALGLGNKKTHILVPVDFSVHSYAAVDFAASLALSMEGNVTMLYVDEQQPASSSPPGGLEFVEHRSRIWNKLIEFQPPESQAVFKHKILSGKPAQQILHYSKRKHFDFIIVGTHGRSGLGRLVLGSVAEEVIRNADCPVIAVKPSNKRNPVLHG